MLYYIYIYRGKKFYALMCHSSLLNSAFGGDTLTTEIGQVRVLRWQKPANAQNQRSACCAVDFLKNGENILIL